MCGRLHCETQSERPIYGDPSSVMRAYSYIKLRGEDHQCHVIRTNYVGSKGPDPGMVLDGSVCGRDKVLCIFAMTHDDLDLCEHQVYTETGSHEDGAQMSR